MNLSVIIVSYNTKELLKQCIDSLLFINGLTGWRVEVIVVDNGSTDGSVELVNSLTRNKKIIKLIKNKKNLGFAKAVNQGIKIAKGEYVLLLNPDTKVIDNALEMMIDFAKNHTETGIIGGRLLNPDGTIQGSCFHQLSLLNAIRDFWLGRKGDFEKYAPKTAKPVEVKTVVGACMMIPKKVIEKAGLFDERYFLYFEDLDYCRRVKKAGFKIYYLPKARFVHAHGVSGREISKQTRRWLVESSRIYHGALKYYLLTFIIWLGQKCRKILKS